MIVRIRGDQKSQIDEFVQEYYKQMDEKLIKPIFLEDIFDSDFTPDKTFLTIMSEQGVFQGLAIYRRIPSPYLNLPLSTYVNVPIAYDKRVKIEPEDITIGNLRNIRKCDLEREIIELSAIESFTKGNGSRLVKEIQGEPNVGGIFTDPLTDVVPFYIKMGFKKTGIEGYFGPVMLWINQ